MRQLYDHAPSEFNDVPEDEGTLRQRAWMVRDTPPRSKTTFRIETETPENPAVEGIKPKTTVGIDLGVLNFIHDSDGRSIGRLDLSEERERLEREQRSLSQRRRVGQLGDTATTRRNGSRPNVE